MKRMTTPKPESKSARAARIAQQVEDLRRDRDARQAGWTEKQKLDEAFAGLD